MIDPIQLARECGASIRYDAREPSTTPAAVMAIQFLPGDFLRFVGRIRAEAMEEAARVCASRVSKSDDTHDVDFWMSNGALGCAEAIRAMMQEEGR